MIVVPRTEHGARGLYQCKDGYVLKVTDDVDNDDDDDDDDDDDGDDDNDDDGEDDDSTSKRMFMYSRWLKWSL